MRSFFAAADFQSVGDHVCLESSCDKVVTVSALWMGGSGGNGSGLSKFLMKRVFLTSQIERNLIVLVGFFLFLGIDERVAAQTSYTSNSEIGTWLSARWNNSTDGPLYTETYTLNRNVIFTSGVYTFAGMGGSINVGNITVNDGVSVTFSSISNTFATAGLVRTINVGTGSVLDFALQNFSTAAGTGFIKSGAGVLALSGNTYGGGFTLNAGTVIARGVNAFGGAVSNVLTLNGGTVASDGTLTFLNTKYGGGIVIGGNVQFGELATNVSQASSAANLSFANDVSLGGATRTLTLGNNGAQTLSGIISNSGSGGITFAANPSTSGRFEITNTANTFTGDITITGGTVRFAADGSMGNAGNDIVVDGGRLATTDGASFALGAGRSVFVGDGAGTSISTTGAGSTLTIGSEIANKAGETGSWSKQGAGVLILSGANTYSGNTSVNEGTLIVNGDQSVATGTVTVISGATLSGDGAIGGDTTISGNLRVGSSAAAGATGSLDFSGENLSFTSSSTWFIDIVGANFDSVIGIDEFSIDPAASLDFNFSSPTEQSYTLASYTRRANTNTFSNFANDDVFSGYRINYSDTAITLTAIPEPGTIGLLGVLLGGLLYQRIRSRRRRAAADVL